MRNRYDYDSDTDDEPKRVQSESETDDEEQEVAQRAQSESDDEEQEIAQRAQSESETDDEEQEIVERAQSETDDEEQEVAQRAQSESETDDEEQEIVERAQSESDDEEQFEAEAETEEEIRAEIEKQFSRIQNALHALPDNRLFTPSTLQACQIIDKDLFNLHEFLIEKSVHNKKENIIVFKQYLERLVELKLINEERKPTHDNTLKMALLTAKKLFTADSDNQDEKEMDTFEEAKSELEMWNHFGIEMSEKKLKSLTVLEAGCGSWMIPAFGLLKSTLETGIKLQYVGIDSCLSDINKCLDKIEYCEDYNCLEDSLLQELIDDTFKGNDANKKAKFINGIKNLRFACGDIGSLNYLQKVLHSEVDIVMMRNPRILPHIPGQSKAFRNFFNLLPQITSPDTKILVQTDDFTEYLVFALLNPALKVVHVDPKHDFCISELKNVSGPLPTPTPKLDL